MPREIQPEVLAEKLRAPGAVHLLDVRLPQVILLASIPGTSQVIPVQQLVRRLAEVQPRPGALLEIYVTVHGSNKPFFWHDMASSVQNEAIDIPMS